MHAGGESTWANVAKMEKKKRCLSVSHLPSVPHSRAIRYFYWDKRDILESRKRNNSTATTAARTKTVVLRRECVQNQIREPDLFLNVDAGLDYEPSFHLSTLLVVISF